MSVELTANDVAQFNSHIANQANQQQQQPQQSTGMFDNDMNSPGANAARGALAGFGNTYINAANMLPGVNIPNIQRPSGIASGLGNFAGNVGGFVAGGEGLDAARALGEGLPMVGKALSTLGQSGAVPSLARRAIGSGAYGMVNDPQNRLGGALAGSLLSAGMDSISPAIGAVSNLADKFSASKQMQNILQNLGGGQGLEANQQSIANNVSQAYQKAKDANSDLYQPIMNQIGDKPIYDTDNLQSNYLGLPGKYQNAYSSDTEELHNNFLNNPTFGNAKELSSQIYSQIAPLQKQLNMGTIDTAGRKELSQLYANRNGIGSDMDTFLKNNSPALAEKYGEAKQDFINNVLPYRADPSIRNIANEKITNPQNVSSYFASPEPSTIKVMSDLPPQTLNNILYDKLGTPTASKSPENFLRAYDNLDKQGLTSAITPDVEAQMNNLRSKVNTKEGIGQLAGMMGGAVLGGHLGEGGELLGGLVGKTLFPWMMNRSSTGANMAGRGIAAMNNPARTAIIAQNLGSNQ